MKRLVFVLLILACTTSALASGLVTHLVVARRAVHLYTLDPNAPYRDILLRHPASWQAGAVFPDWGYTPDPRKKGPDGNMLNANEEAADAAHRTPFLLVATEHLRAMKPGLMRDQFIAFLFGVLAHQVADVYWHQELCEPWSGLERFGFLQAMRDADFMFDAKDFQSFDAMITRADETRSAHHIGDRAGEAFLPYRMNLDWIGSSFNFSEPAVLAVYKRMDVETNLGQLQRFTQLETAYARGLAAASKSAKARELVEKGLYAYASWWSPWMSENIETFAVGGIDDNAVWTAQAWPMLAAWMDAEPKEAVPGPNGLACIRFAPVVSNEKAAPRGEVSTTYGYTGTSLATGDFDRDGVDELVVGVPGASRAGRPQQGLVRAGELTLEGTEKHGRFGAAVAVLDFNADGFDDLAVGAPVAGDHALPDRGAVTIHLGRRDAPHLSSTPDFTLRFDEPFAAFGMVLASGDADGDGFDDLLVGAPQLRTVRLSGYAAIYLSSKENVPGTTVAPAWSRRSNIGAERFGGALGITRLHDGTRLLLVSAAGAKHAGQAEVGRLYGFDLTPLAATPRGEPTLRFTLTGATLAERAGASFAIGNPRNDGEPLIAIAQPTSGPEPLVHAGAVLVVPLASLQGEMTTAALKPLLRIQGDQRFARFGWQVAFGDVDGDGIDDLVVSEPMRRETIGVDAGSVGVWRGGTSFPTGTIPRTSATWRFDAPRPRMQYGRVFTLLGKRLAIAAPFDSANGEMAGSVTVVAVK